MSLKKPSDLFEKKDTSGVFDNPEVSFNITESYDKFRNNFEKVNELSEKVEILSQQLSEKLTRTDLESAMLSQLMVLDENFKSIQSQVNGLNKKDLKEFKDNIFSIAKLVENLIEEEIPKYKKQITKNEFFVGEQVDKLKQVIEKNIVNIHEEINDKFDNIVEVVNNNIEYFDQKILENSVQAKKTADTYTNLSKILENKVSKENKKLEEYSNLIENLSEAFEEFSLVLKNELSEFSQLTENKFEKYKNKINSIQTEIQTSVDTRLEDYHKELVDVKSDVVVNEQHIKNVDKYLKEHHQELVELKEEVFGEIENLPLGNLQENLDRLERKIDYIKETYSKIKPEVLVKEVINEGLLNEPPETKNSDPLTPLNQNFVTLDQLQEHYRLFINRIQQQLATLGGGGETRLKYLDDIVGIATNSSAYDGKFLKYDHSIGKFVFETVSAGSGGILYTDLSVTVSPEGSSTLTYDNTTGVFDYTPPDLTGYATTSSLVGFITSGALSGYATEGYVNNAVVGFITSGSSGSNLTGIVTSITAGTGISINQSTGNVVITGTALTNLSVNVSPVGTSTLSYNNSTGVFNYTPPSFVGYATEGYVTQQITSLINNAPSALDTLNELATALNNDANFSTTITNSLAQKANLSGANFTGVVTATNFSGNLTGTASTASFATTSYYLNGQASSYYLDYNNFTNTPNIPSDTGDLTNSVGFITSSNLSGYATTTSLVGFITSGALSGYATEGYVNNAISGLSTFSGNYNDLTNKPFIPSDTGDLTNSVGFITSSSLVGYATEGYVTNSLVGYATTTSLVGFITFGSLVGYATEGYVTNAISGLSTFSGNYNDLTNKPTIPSDTGDLTNSVGFITSGALSGYATEGYVSNSLTGYATTLSLVGFITSGTLIGYATEGYVNNAIVGFITSGGSGSNLTGIVTSIVAGTGISINQSTGRVTITATGGGTGGGIGLGDLSVTTSSAGVSTLTYDNTTGVFTYTPPDLTGYATTTSIVGFITSGALSGYATEGYVTNSLVGYATEGYVNNAVVGFITSGNLTGYATTLSLVGFITSGALSGYATQGYVTNSLVGYATQGYVNNAVVGFITSGGSGSGLTGIVTSITAGTNITINQSTGNVTISASGGNQNLNTTLGFGNTSSLGMSVGVVTATSFVKSGGTSTQFLKADGSVDTNTYLTTTGSGSGLTGIVTSITAGNGISINQSTGNVTITGTAVTSGANNTFSGITTFSGNVFTTAGLQVQQVEETYNSYSTTIGAGATVALDCSTGNTFYITSTVNGNWTANLTNLNLSANCLTNVTLMITQSATAYIPNALQIGGVAQTINWQGGSIPGGNNSKKDAVAFTIFYTGSAYNVFGQLVTFG